MSFDSQESVITVRGRSFPLATLAEHENATVKVLEGAVLALYALEDPRVDDILKKMKFVFVWPNGMKQPLFEEAV